MDEWNISVYMHEIANQVINIRLAARDIDSAQANPDVDSVARAFMAVQGMLAASSMISKILYPNPASLDREGNRLTGDAEDRRKRTLV